MNINQNLEAEVQNAIHRIAADAEVSEIDKFSMLVKAISKIRDGMTAEAAITSLKPKKPCVKDTFKRVVNSSK